jgi:hypothetical protein
LPAGLDENDVERVVASATSTLAFYGGHTDADYARSVQGRAHVYLATGPILGLLDRFVTQWAGPESFLVKRSMRMVDSLYAGDELRFEGSVTKAWLDVSSGRVRRLVSLALEIHARGRCCVTATATYELPDRGAEARR